MDYFVPNVVGLVNKKSDCYVNSALQGLFHTPVFVKLMNLYGTSINNCNCTVAEACGMTCALNRTLARYKVENVPFEANLILGKVKDITNLQRGTHEDPMDLILPMLSELTVMFRSMGLDDAIDYAFQGVITRNYACALCDHEDNVQETFHQLPLPIILNGNTLEKEQTLEDALLKYFKTNYFLKRNCGNQDNKCPNIFSKMTTTITILPKVMFIKLMRPYNEQGIIQQTAVRYPEYLQLPNSILGLDHTQIPQYRLTAHLRHHGITKNFGHFTATASTALNQYFKFNDNLVPELQTDLQDILSTKASILIYEQIGALDQIQDVQQAPPHNAMHDMDNSVDVDDDNMCFHQSDKFDGIETITIDQDGVFNLQEIQDFLAPTEYEVVDNVNDAHPVQTSREEKHAEHGSSNEDNLPSHYFMYDPDDDSPGINPDDIDDDYTIIYSEHRDMIFYTKENRKPGLRFTTEKDTDPFRMFTYPCLSPSNEECHYFGRTQLPCPILASFQSISKVVISNLDPELVDHKSKCCSFIKEFDKGYKFYPQYGKFLDIKASELLLGGGVKFFIRNSYPSLHTFAPHKWEKILQHFSTYISDAIEAKKSLQFPEEIQNGTAKFLDKNNKDYQSLMESTVPIPPFACELCGKCFYRKEAFTLHKQIHLPLDKKKSFPCEVCKKVLASNKILKRHRKIHLPEEESARFPCEVCKKVLASNNNLKQHQQMHLLEEERARFTCDICQKSYTHKSSLKAHQNIHNAQEKRKSFKCDVCKKLFQWQSNLRSHKAIHIVKDKKKSFPCDVCKKVLASNKNLKQHQQMHLPEEEIARFMCEVCKKVFQRKANLDRHEQTHLRLNVKKISICEFCDKSFKRQSNFNIHKHQCVGLLIGDKD